MLSITPKRKQGTDFLNFTSPSKKKKPYNEEEDELSATQIDFLDDMNATQVDFMIGDKEEKKELPSYKLTVFGEEDVVCFVKEKEISCPWSDEPFSVGRIMFLNMPEEHKNRISRKHFEIHCSTNEDNEKEVWLMDRSANGTMVDGELGYLGKKTLLEDGSAIGLLLSVEKDRILFGYSFSTTGIPKKASKEDKKAKNKSAGKVGLGVGAKAIGKANNTTRSEKANGIKTNGENKATNGREKSNGAEKKKSDGAKTNGKGGENAVFAVPAPISIKPKAKLGFMNGVRFALIGYSEAVLEDPKKKKLIKELCDRGATYVLHPEPTNVDIIVLNRNYFKEPASHDINLPSLTLSLRVRFIGNTRWLEECVREGRKLELRDEILAPHSGGVIVLDTKRGSSVHGLEPRIASQLASMLREEKRTVGAKWKVIAPLALIASCAGMLEGLESTVEGLKKEEKGDNSGDFMLRVRETHAVGYRHVLHLVNEKGLMNNVDKVVSVVDGSGLIEFAQKLHAQRKEGLGQNSIGAKR